MLPRYPSPDRVKDIPIVRAPRTTLVLLALTICWSAVGAAGQASAAFDVSGSMRGPLRPTDVIPTEMVDALANEAPSRQPPTMRAPSSTPVMSSTPLFTEPISLDSPGSYQMSEARIGDISGDGLADLVTAVQPSCSCYEELRTFIQQTDGSMLPGQTFPTVPSGDDFWPDGPLAVGDLGRDGDVDVVVGSWGLGLWVMENDTGSLKPPLRLEAEGGYKPSIVDIDGDGYEDIVHSYDNYNPNKGLSIFLGGASGFTPGGTVPTDGWIAYAIDATDATADGLPDLLLMAPGALLLIEQAAGGGWEPAVPLHASTTSSYKPQFAVADMNGAGDQDIVYLSGSDVTVWLATSAGLGAPRTFRIADYGESINAADIDGDDDTDLLITHHANFDTPNRLGVMKGDGQGNLTHEVVYLAPDQGVIDVADLNNDGRTDLLARMDWGPPDFVVEYAAPKFEATIPSSVLWNHTLQVPVHLAGDHPSQPTVELYEIPVQAWDPPILVDTAAFDIQGDAVLSVPNMQAGARYTVRWEGDGHYGGIETSRDVGVRVIVKGKLFRKGAYVTFASMVIPNQSGEKISFKLQRRDGGRWRTMGDVKVRLSKDSVAGVGVPINALQPGRYRLSADFPPRNGLMGNTSGYFTFRA